jgi:lipopolysaccharide/colanic/teichoic acid biosynthesis glycosyltransferase
VAHGGEVVRRTIDVTGAALLLVLLSPVLLATALVVLAHMGRPVLFRQVRVGRDGREFRIAKFRTMRPPRWRGEPDAARDTRVGRLMRMASLDELPQLWNVLTGDMAFIGPRPTLPEQVVHYTPDQRGRLAVRPGLTGWAQVNGRNSIPWPERIELDLYYVRNRTIWLDLRILLRTLSTLAHPRGVYGPGGVNHKFPVPTRSDATEPATRRERGLT